MDQRDENLFAEFHSPFLFIFLDRTVIESISMMTWKPFVLMDEETSYVEVFDSRESACKIIFLGDPVGTRDTNLPRNFRSARSTLKILRGG